MNRLVRFGISLEEGLLRSFDRLIRQRGYGNRSEAIRDLIRADLVSQEWREGGEVVGVVPNGLESPQLVYTSGLTKLEIVADIQVRKARMIELAEAFITLPGGYGTLDEMFEVLSWSQIGRHRKPNAFLNTNGYFDHLFEWVQRAYRDHFIYEEHLDLFVADAEPGGLLEKLAAFKFPTTI